MIFYEFLQEITSVAAQNSGKSVVTICVNARQNQKQPNGAVCVENKGQAPFYLHQRQSEDPPISHQKIISTTVISKPDLTDVDLRKSNLRCTSDNSNKNTVTFNFGCNDKPESRSVSIFQQPNGILKNGTNGNISQVQIQNIQPGAATNRVHPQQKTIKFGGM